MTKREKLRMMIRAATAATDTQAKSWVSRRILRQVGRFRTAAKRAGALNLVPDDVLLAVDAGGLA